MDSTTFVFRLPKETLDHLKVSASTLDLTVAQLVRRLCNEFLAKEEGK